MSRHSCSGTTGGIAVLGARDCSIQRRHQKLIEESPAVGLDPSAWPRIAAGAVAFAEAIGYEGAGTAEFLVDGPDVYFLELNGRIQVEHPVTEEVTGLDIVELQLRVAAGEPVELADAARGHAIEARLYAEDPQSFLPQAGAIRRLVLPAAIRVDAGVEEGDEIGLSYDPLIAKLIALGADRDDAIARLELALDATVVDGVTTNLPFLRWLVRHPAFRSGSISTAFLREHAPLSAAPLRPPPSAFAHAWRLNGPAPPPRAGAGGGGDPARVGLTRPGHDHGADAGHRARRRGGGRATTSRRTIPLVVLEAMKMEMPVLAPFTATVTAVHVAARRPGRLGRGARRARLAARRGSPESPSIARSSRLSATLTSHITITAPTYVQKPSIEKFGTTHSVNARIATLTKKYAIPKVRMISGIAMNVSKRLQEDVREPEDGAGEEAASPSARS